MFGKGLLDRQAKAMVARRMRDEKLLVTNPDEGMRLWRWDVGVWVLVFAAWLTNTWWDDTWVSLAAGPFVGGFLGAQVVRRVARARSYRSGWIDGRYELVASLREATQRGMTLTEWLESQWERDAILLGINPRLFDSEDDDP